ncbi:hypothetical protein ABZ135_36505 [Streptomyces sp. NPDC006339]|uniref:hypothetical protein n=1 Tax=Streptomyces sp. NPDC006339 TaxID=3156755 RepID=UPI0033BC9307
MPLATPRTWVVGEVVTAALMNAEIRDQLNTLTADDVTVRKSGDTTRASTTTMANDPDLTIGVVANGVYRLTGYIVYSQNLAASASSGIKIGWSGPALATMQWTSGGTDGPTSLTGQDVTSNSISQTRSLPSNLGTFMSAIPVGYLAVAGTAGSLSFQWAQVASNATGTIVRAGSWINLRRIA